jgi:hypothetical protein
MKGDYFRKEEDEKERKGGKVFKQTNPIIIIIFH